MAEVEPAFRGSGSRILPIFRSGNSLFSQQRPAPDGLRRKGVTLFLLWQEYRETHPKGYQYSWFCEYYRTWRGKLDVVMRQDHRAGEKLFVDYAGQTMAVVDPDTGAGASPGNPTR